MSSNRRSTGTSRSCLNCRSKRKRCDLRNPCQRCITSNTSCSGPVQGAVFVNSSGKSLKEQSHRAALHTAIAGRRHLNEAQGTLAPKTLAHQLDFSDHAVKVSNHYLPSAMTNVVPLGLSYKCLLEDFQQTIFGAIQGRNMYGGVSVHSDIALCMQTVVSLASSPSTGLCSLDLGIFSLLNLYIGKMCRDDVDQVGLARRSYVSALQELRQELEAYNIDAGIRQVHLHRSQRIFCFCLALISYELMNGGTLTASLDTHIDGALGVLRLTGPAILDSVIVRQAFGAFRGVAYSSAARRRLSLFLDEPQWLNESHDGKPKQQWERLYDIALKLPRLLQRTDVLKSSSFLDAENVPASREIRKELLHEYVTLEFQLHRWHQQQSLENQNKDTDRPGCLLDRPVVGQTSCDRLLHLATMLLELQMGLSDLSSVLQWDTDLLFIDQYFRIDSSLAAMVADSVQCLAQHNEGRLIASVPSETLARYCSRSSWTKPQAVVAEKCGGVIDDVTRTLQLFTHCSIQGTKF